MVTDQKALGGGVWPQVPRPSQLLLQQLQQQAPLRTSNGLMLLRCVSCNRQAHLHTSDLLPCTGTCIQGCSLNACRRSVGPPPAHSILILAKTMQLQVLGPQRFNPGVPLSAEVRAIHGITDADVAACPRFEEAAAEWQQFLQGCDLHGYNAKKFDVPILR